MNSIMGVITQEELNEVIRKHGLWLRDNNDPEGERADLSGKDLSGLDLHGSDLRRANLDHAILQGANLKGADLRGADLRHAALEDANLEGADIDYSSLPLWCGGLGWKIDKRIASQLIYHVCSMKCGDGEFIEARNYLLKLANKFHCISTGECKELKEIPLPSSE
jgi:hypothetical protein